LNNRSHPSRVRRGVVAALGVVGLTAAALAVGGSPAGATDITPSVTQAIGSVTSVDVTPFPAATNTSSVTVTITGARDASNNLLNGAAAATMCANADTSGTPLAALPPGNTSCDGQNQVADITFVVFAGGNATFTKALKASAIGDDAATCVSGGLIPCQFGLGDVATSGAAFAIAVPVFSIPTPPSTTVTPAVAAARPGDALSFTGVDYTPSAATGTASLCDTDGVSNCQSLDTVTIGVDAGGALTGSGTIPAAATTGSRRLVVSTGSGPSARSASATFVVLGARTVVLTPSSGGIGATISVSGSGFDPGATLLVVPSDGTGALAAPVTTTASATGTFSGVSVTVVAGTIGIAASEADNPTTEFGFAPFSVSATSCSVAGDTGTCTVEQGIVQQVNGGQLSMTEAAPTITMSPVTLDGSSQTSTGALNQVTVTDARGTLTGWTLTGSVTDLTTGAGGTNRTIVNTNISWTPACSATTGSASEISTGAAGVIPSNSMLCSAGSGGGGGSFHADAGVSVVVPPTVARGTYNGTLTLTLTGL
jgi:hypothetical protein